MERGWTIDSLDVETSLSVGREVLDLHCQLGSAESGG